MSPTLTTVSCPHNPWAHPVNTAQREGRAEGGVREVHGRGQRSWRWRVTGADRFSEWNISPSVSFCLSVSTLVSWLSSHPQALLEIIVFDCVSSTLQAPLQMTCHWSDWPWDHTSLNLHYHTWDCQREWDRWGIERGGWCHWWLQLSIRPIFVMRQSVLWWPHRISTYIFYFGVWCILGGKGINSLMFSWKQSFISFHLGKIQLYYLSFISHAVDLEKHKCGSINTTQTHTGLWICCIKWFQCVLRWSLPLYRASSPWCWALSSSSMLRRLNTSRSSPHSCAGSVRVTYLTLRYTNTIGW